MQRLAEAKKRKTQVNQPVAALALKKAKEAAPLKSTTPRSSPEAIVINNDTMPISAVLSKPAHLAIEVARPPPPKGSQSKGSSPAPFQSSGKLIRPTN